jgi:hypothetical protein
MRWPFLLVARLSLVSLALLGAASKAPVVELDAARRLLPIPDACASVDCLLVHAYQTDPKASELALRLWRESGDVAGVGPEEVMDGGFRGTIHLVPQLPINGYRKHLAWVLEGTRAIDDFFSALQWRHRPRICGGARCALLQRAKRAARDRQARTQGFQMRAAGKRPRVGRPGRRVLCGA